MFKILKEISSMQTESPSYKTTINCSSVFNLLTAHISQLPEIENFNHIGEICFSQDGQDYYYEVNCRLNTSEQTEETELLFNDITRTRIKEIENQEYKHKSLYFSKVIHEFKNPLICICELVNQTQEIIPRSKLSNFNSSIRNFVSNLEEINSMANFLQILIKDFTHLTQSQFQKVNETEYNKDETDLHSVVDFCSRIGKTLIKKYEKNDKVEFKFCIDSQVPNKILTDEWKLKQILINLISNSIKFTFSGRISLDLSIEKLDERIEMLENPDINDKSGFLQTNSNSNPYRLKITVKDSGVGMSEEIVNNLSKPFKMENKIPSNKSINDKKYNEFGSGLGLSIAYEMTSKLGSRLECESAIGNGTSYWFYIPIEKQTSNNYEINVNIEPEATPYCYVIEEDKDSNKLDCLFNQQVFRKTSNSSFKSFKSNSTKKIINFSLHKPLGMEEIYNSYNIEIEIPQSHIQLANFINIVVCDDESLVRQSTIRTIKNVCKSLNLNVNIIETLDGIETLSLVYNYLKSGNKISLIFSDENMVCMNGRASSGLIHQVIKTKKSEEIPFYLLTAGDANIPINTPKPIPVKNFPKTKISNLGLERNHTTNYIGITKVLEKPLEKNVALEIFKQFK
jgi:signal transduction histidine kinase